MIFVAQKVFCLDEAERTGLTASAVGFRLRQGKYGAAVAFRRHNQRVVEVAWTNGPVTLTPKPRTYRYGSEKEITHTEYMRRWRAGITLPNL